MNFIEVLLQLLSSKSAQFHFTVSSVKWSLTVAVTGGAPAPFNFMTALQIAMLVMSGQPAVQSFKVGGTTFTATLARA